MEPLAVEFSRPSGVAVRRRDGSIGSLHGNVGAVPGFRRALRGRKLNPEFVSSRERVEIAQCFPEYMSPIPGEPVHMNGQRSRLPNILGPRNHVVLLSGAFAGSQ